MAGPIPNLTATANALMSWNAQTTDPVLGTRTSTAQLSVGRTFSSATGATYPANQIKVKQISIPAGGTVTVDLTAADGNVLQNTAATLARVFSVIAWLPNTTQNSTLGSSASSVTIGVSPSAPANILGLADSSSSLDARLGEMHFWDSPVATGYALTSAQKNLQIVNNDSTNAATLLLALLGSDV